MPTRRICAHKVERHRSVTASIMRLKEDGLLVGAPRAPPTRRPREGRVSTETGDGKRLFSGRRKQIPHTRMSKLICCTNTAAHTLCAYACKCLCVQGLCNNIISINALLGSFLVVVAVPAGKEKGLRSAILLRVEHIIANSKIKPQLEKCTFKF